MIVIDASAMVEALVGREVDEELLDALGSEVAAPHLLDVEVLSVLRGLELGRKLARERADAARIDHFDLHILRHDTAPLAERIWELRHQHTAYDAAYLALAEALNAPLHTCDAKLAGTSHDARVHVHSRTH
ncbi:type II toxin-antitoxin system VapC family toxin [Ornithinimicrobium cavernae]|uniref:type II toxin-antitoxin system VapC family toxin n=1 Tax=Ornithinimicrobium cavernae TaxID=2666047 RepID=UPI000D685DD9|nr:type II toxin-antitoxin system VapC family toxin [Ornithinimicrobium cavernae]